jgi:hypothetical protein
LDISRAITPIRVRRTTSSKLRLDELDLRIISASKSFSGSQEEDQNVKSLRTDDERNVMAKARPEF